MTNLPPIFQFLSLKSLLTFFSRLVGLLAPLGPTAHSELHPYFRNIYPLFPLSRTTNTTNFTDLYCSKKKSSPKMEIVPLKWL